MDEQLRSRDLLSDIPLDIIHIILSFVPIRDAIRTSLLSRKWRYIWISLPYLAFDEKCIYPLMEDESDVNRLISFISQVLLLHKGPIHTLKICFLLCFLLEDMSRVQYESINQWLLFLSRNDIRILVLYFTDMDPCIEVHNSLYSFQNLTHLELDVYTIPPPPPSFKGFLFLRSLHIETYEVDSRTIECIVARSPMLERLTLLGEQYSEIIRIPNLKFFYCRFSSTYLCFSTPLLEELRINFRDIKLISIHESSVFRHLRIIKIYNVFFDRTEVAMAIDRLITSSPNLQELEIIILSLWKYDAPELACASIWNTESAPNISFDSLKVIKMEFSSCGINAMKLVKFLLARSPVLERMIYMPHWLLSEPIFQNITAILLSCPRASTNAEIVVHNNPSTWGV